MTELAILAGNIEIAKFLGWEQKGVARRGLWPWGKKEFYYAHSGFRFKVWTPFFEYYCNWNHLMEAVDKIESLHDDHHGYFGVHISSNSCNIQGTNLWKSVRDGIDNYGPVYMSDPNAVFPTKIESTFYAVVQFIKWYNTQINDPDH